MSLKPSFRSLPVFLTGCLLAVSFTIVNCQKAPNRNGVKAKPSALTEGQQKAGADAAAADAATKQQLAATKACGDDLKNDHKKMTELRDVKKLWSISALKKAEAEIENIRKLRSEFLSLCVTADKALNEFEEKSCIKDMEIEAKHKEKKNDQEKVKNTIGLVQITLACQKILADCEKEHTKVKCETSNYVPSKVTDGKRVAGGATVPAKSNVENLKKFFAKNLLMSDAMKDMSAGIGFTKYAYKGKIYTNAEKNARDLADKKEVLCSIGGLNVKMIEKEMSMVIKAVSFIDVQKTSPNKEVSALDWDLRLVDGFEGESVSISFTRVKDESETDDSDYGPALNIVCLNLNKDKMVEKDFRDAFGLLLKDLTDAELNKLKEANKAKRPKSAAPAKQEPTKTDPAGKTGAGVSDADKAKQDLAKAQGELTTAKGEKGKLKKLEADLVIASKAVKDAADELAKQPEKIKLAEKSLQTAKDELAKMDASTAPAEKTKKEQEVSKKDEELKAEQAKVETISKDIASKKVKEAELKLEIAKEKKAIADLEVKINALEIKVAGSESADLKVKKDAAAQLLANAVAEVAKEEASLSKAKEAAGVKTEAKKDEKKDDKKEESEEMKSAKASIVEVQARVNKAMPLQKAAEDFALASNKKVADIQAAIVADEAKLAELKKSTPDGDHSAIEAKIAAAKREKQTAVTAAVAALKDEAVKELELRTAERALASLELHLAELEIQANKGVETAELKDKREKATAIVQQKQAALEKTLAAKKDLEESFK